MTSASTSLLAVIPARGGSRRVPKKNIRVLRGRPLIQYTIAAALDSGVFADVIVSTDDGEIAEIAKACGAQVPFMRPAGLADDHTPVSAVTVDALRLLDPRGDRYESVAQLMPNCPLRTHNDVQDSLAHFRGSGAEFQISVCRYGWFNPWWAMSLRDDGVLSPLFAERLADRSQDQPELYCPSGAIWWASTGALRSVGTFHTAVSTGWTMPWEHALDIDTEDDWRMVEAVLARAHTP